MTDPPHDTGNSTSTPRWVKVSGVIVIVLLLLFVIMMLAGGEHGPGRYLPSSNPGSLTPLGASSS